MIPELVQVEKSPWLLLPPGIHMTDLATVNRRFAFNSTRRKLFNGLVEASKILRRAGCRRLYLNGSFVTQKPIPNDYDACWDLSGVNRELVDPIFFNFTDNRAEQKTRFLGEFFPSTYRVAGIEMTFIEFFQIDTLSQNRKGIIGLDLPNDPMLN